MLIYYVTGHGFGHARRSNEIIVELLRQDPHLHIHLRTLVPPDVFDLSSPRIEYTPIEIDRGCIEFDPLHLDWDTTLKSVSQLIANRQAFIEQESAFARTSCAKMILADIPFLPGFIADRVAIPCYAIGNFTWDWIYEPYATGSRAALLGTIRAGYNLMTGTLRLPFPQPAHPFKQAIDVPLIARAIEIDPADIRRRLEISPSEKRPLALIAMRGGLPDTAIQSAVRESPDILFVSRPSADLPPIENLRFIETDATTNFTDVLAACDVVISKLGHGIITDCIATQTALLWPPRTGFREDNMVIDAAQPYLRSQEIPVDQFLAGQWRNHLQTLLAKDLNKQTLPINGAQVITSHVLSNF